MIFQIDKTIYEQLSETERYIVDFIIQNENKISYLSITNIADKTFSSPATVSRTIQKCGFKGIAELRYLISKEDKDRVKMYPHMPSINYWIKSIKNLRKLLKIFQFLQF